MGDVEIIKHYSTEEREETYPHKNSDVSSFLLVSSSVILPCQDARSRQRHCVYVCVVWQVGQHMPIIYPGCCWTGHTTKLCLSSSESIGFDIYSLPGFYESCRNLIMSETFIPDLNLDEVHQHV